MWINPGQLRQPPILALAKGNPISRKAATAQNNSRMKPSNLFHSAEVDFLKLFVSFV
jgi:hypothetical protein